ncbi:pentapeptide repeat-containing protein [Haloarchaeobius sp. DT45]|uniref:pentapeptide repeat-containing protein n=1 Tax=Haloarchaeobius sp. DT45 TaxID=3446116 RepID=UPI003F6CECD1
MDSEDFLRWSLFNDPSTWECPYEDAEGDYCLFHMDPDERDKAGISDQDVMDKFSEIVSNPNMENNFTGSKFGEFTPSETTLDHLKEDGVNFFLSEFHGPVDVSGAIIWGMSMVYCTFFDSVEFSELELTGHTIFRFSEIHGEFGIKRCDVTGYIDLLGVSFDNSVRVSGEFENHVTLKESTFNGPVRLRGATFRGNLSMEDVHFEDHLDMVWLTCEGGLNIVPRSTSGDVKVNLGASNVSGGNLHIPTPDSVHYNLNLAEIGRVRITSGEEVVNTLEHFLFRMTTFNNFDFQLHRSLFIEADWNLHETSLRSSDFRPIMGTATMTEDGLVEDNSLDKLPFLGLESTYLKAKSGANLVGDQKAASKFFFKEMYFRRFEHVSNFLSSNGLGERLSYLLYWVVNLCFEVFAGYGEKPHRVLLTYGITILVIVPLFDSMIPKGVSGVIHSFFVALFVFSLTRSVER